MKIKSLGLILVLCMIMPCVGIMMACNDKEDTNIYVSEQNTLLSAVDKVDNGGHIVLNVDVTLDTALIVDKQFTINLNQHRISVPNDTVGDGVFRVKQGGKLIIEGDGVIDGTGQNDYNIAIWADGGEVIINGGTFTNNTIIGNDIHYDLIYASNGGMVTINNGTFVCKTPKWTLNLKDNSNSQMIVKGGMFKNYNPAISQTESPVANFVADGYESVQTIINNQTWYVVRAV